MHSLTQLLRNLSHKDFEALCFHLLKERYPNANIRRMEGSGGDKGIDLFAGRLLDRSCIWQCKHFPNGVKRPQRRQIEKSFETALRNYRPKRWILCLSVDLDPNGRDWFEKLQRKHEPEVEIDLIQGSDIDHALMYHQAIREKFFPEAQVNVRELKALLAGTEKFSNEELEKVTLANAQEYLARLQEKDPRFAYDLTFSGGGPVPFVGDPTSRPLREGKSVV